MDQLELIASLDRHLNASALKFGIVAFARTIRGNGSDWLELRAAVWRNRRLQSHVRVVANSDLQSLSVSAIADAFITHVNSLFPADLA